MVNLQKLNLQGNFTKYWAIEISSYMVHVHVYVLFLIVIFIFLLLSIAPTAPPGNFTINTTSFSRSLSFSWDPPPPEHRHGIILYYNLTCYETVGRVLYLITTPSFPLILNESDSVQFVLFGFRPGILINCSLTSSNDAGIGPYAASAYITTVQEGKNHYKIN